jgi:hypothetical protein
LIKKIYAVNLNLKPGRVGPPPTSLAGLFFERIQWAIFKQ